MTRANPGALWGAFFIILATICFLSYRMFRKRHSLTSISSYEQIAIVFWCLVAGIVSATVLSSLATVTAISLVACVMSWYSYTIDQSIADANRTQILWMRNGVFGISCAILAICFSGYGSSAWIGLLVLFPPAAWFFMHQLFEDYFYRSNPSNAAQIHVYPDPEDDRAGG